MPPMSKQEQQMMNAEYALKVQERSLENAINKSKKAEAKEKKELLKMMKAGDDDMIDDQAVMLASIQGDIKEMTRTKNNLRRFAAKVSQMRKKQQIGQSMVQVSKALGQITANMQLDKVEAIMTELGKQYEDIDVMSSVMDTATTQATAKQVPQEVVDRLKRQVADEAGLELRQDLESATAVTKEPVKNAVSAEAEDELQQRLGAMRAGAA